MGEVLKHASDRVKVVVPSLCGRCLVNAKCPPLRYHNCASSLDGSASHVILQLSLKVICPDVSPPLSCIAHRALQCSAKHRGTYKDPRAASSHEETVLSGMQKGKDHAAPRNPQPNCKPVMQTFRILRRQPSWFRNSLTNGQVSMLGDFSLLSDLGRWPALAQGRTLKTK